MPSGTQSKLEVPLSHRMWVQMAVVLAILVTLPLVLLGGVLVRASQTAVKTSVLRDQEQLAIRAASELGEFLRRPQELLKSTAAILGTLHSDAWKQETALVELSLNEDAFGRISSIDMSGREIVTSDLGIALRDRSMEPEFLTASRGNLYLSKIYFSTDHLPYVTMGVPVKNMGRITGVLAAEVSLRHFWDIVDAIRIGKTGRAYVVSRYGVLIADEDKKRVFANENISGDPAAKAVMEGKAGSMESADALGAWLKAYAPIPGPGWGLVVKQSTAEAYSFLNDMIAQAWVLILSSLLLAALSSALLARRLVSPIQSLAGKMGRVAQGDFGQRMREDKIDEIGDLMRAFNRMTEKLEKARESEKLAVIGKAAAAITHELKNSLVMVSTFIGLLPRRHADPEFIKKFVTLLPNELESWKGMLNDISDFSRKTGFELFELPMTPFLADFTFLVRERLIQNGIRLECEGLGPLPVLLGNAQKLKQALLNLVINAGESMPQGGTVRIALRHRENELEIGVADEGKGIEPDRLPKIFDPFYSTKTNGLGLGLSICREIIEHHGGRISVESRPGVGTEFFVRLPVYSQREPESPVPSESRWN